MLKERSYFKGHNKNSVFVLFVFFATITFQITAYKFIWGIEPLSRLINILLFVISIVYAFYVLAIQKYNKKTYFFYIIPGFFVYAGLLINTTLSTIQNYNLANQYGLLLPWAFYLLMPTFLKSGQIVPGLLWRYFYYFMLVVVVLGIIEYFAIFFNILVPHHIETSGGSFLSGYFSLLFGLENGEIHYRFYAAFLEPATLAMFLLPVIAYSFFYRKYISLVIFIIGLFLSDSLGGFISLAILFSLLIYFINPQKAGIFKLIIMFICALIITSFYFNDFSKRYEDKQDSRIVREENIFGTITSFPDFVLSYPLGLPLSESTENAQKNQFYTGSNFALGNALIRGGVVSFVGYITVLTVSLWYALSSLFRKTLSRDERVVVSSVFCLLPFIFQGSVVWDSTIFGLLFCPYIIGLLQRESKNPCDNKELFFSASK